MLDQLHTGPNTVLGAYPVAECLGAPDLLTSKELERVGDETYLIHRYYQLLVVVSGLRFQCKENFHKPLPDRIQADFIFLNIDLDQQCVFCLFY